MIFIRGIVVGATAWSWITEVYSDAYRQKLIQSWNPLWCIDAVKLTQFFLLRCSVLCPGAWAWRRRKGTKLTQVRCEVDCYAGIHLHKDLMFGGYNLLRSVQEQIVGFLTIYILLNISDDQLFSVFSFPAGAAATPAWRWEWRGNYPGSYIF